MHRRLQTPRRQQLIEIAKTRPLMAKEKRLKQSLEIGSKTYFKRKNKMKYLIAIATLLVGCSTTPSLKDKKTVADFKKEHGDKSYITCENGYLVEHYAYIGLEGELHQGCTLISDEFLHNKECQEPWVNDN